MIQQNYKVINNIQLFFFQYFYILEWNVLISDDMFFSPLYSSTLKKQKQSENDI